MFRWMLKAIEEALCFLVLRIGSSLSTRWTFSVRLRRLLKSANGSISGLAGADSISSSLNDGSVDLQSTESLSGDSPSVRHTLHSLQGITSSRTESSTIPGVGRYLSFEKDIVDEDRTVDKDVN